MAERTLIIIKPDGVQRHLIGEIIGRFEKKGLKLVAAKFLQLSEKQVGQIYAVHREKPFFKPMMKFMSSAPVLVMVWEAEGVIDMTRKMMGATFNLTHGSDSPESAQQEIKLFFAANEIIDYKLTNSPWLYVKSASPKK